MSDVDTITLRTYWIDFAQRYCNRKFDPQKLPPVVELFVDARVKAYRENPDVKSQGLSDMNVTYFDKAITAEEASLLGQVKKLKVPNAR